MIETSDSSAAQPRAAVEAVVVSYNTRACLERCLAELATGEHHVLVVDSASTDGSAELVEGYPGVELVGLTENHGFGAAANRGIARVEAPYVLLLNADAWPLAGAIDMLVAVAELDPANGIVAPRLVNEDGSSQRSVFGYPAGPFSLALWAAVPGAVSKVFQAWRRLQLLVTRRPTGGYETVGGKDFPAGAALLIRMNAFVDVDGFDESFFMYSEETDLCYRVRQRGWRVVLCPEAAFRHVGGASTGQTADQSFREQLRSYLRFFGKHGGERKARRAHRLLVQVFWLRSLMLRGRARSRARDLKEWLRSNNLETLLK